MCVWVLMKEVRTHLSWTHAVWERRRREARAPCFPFSSHILSFCCNTTSLINTFQSAALWRAVIKETFWEDEVDVSLPLRTVRLPVCGSQLDGSCWRLQSSQIFGLMSEIRVDFLFSCHSFTRLHVSDSFSYQLLYKWTKFIKSQKTKQNRLL